MTWQDSRCPSNTWSCDGQVILKFTVIMLDRGWWGWTSCVLKAFAALYGLIAFRSEVISGLNLGEGYE